MRFLKRCQIGYSIGDMYVTTKGSIQVNWTRISQDQIELSVNIPNNIDTILSFEPLIQHEKCIKLICNYQIIWSRNEINHNFNLFKDSLGLSQLIEDQFTGTMSIRIALGEYRFTAFW